MRIDHACGLLETALRARPQIVDTVSDSATLGRALARLRECMRSHVWKDAGADISLQRVVADYDRRTRDEGFHALNDWDGIADSVNADIIPVDVLTYVIDKRGGAPVDRRLVFILIDYYFFHLLSLVALRIWDDDDADAALERLNGLLRELQGADGSGQLFTSSAASLILIATSHFELVERGYATLLERVRTLNPAHRLAIALGHASSIGSHLRFGFEATYARDTVATRQDNRADYPWLCFSLATVMEEYARLQDERVLGTARDAVVEALLNGLTPDARAFVGEPPASLAAFEDVRSGFRARFHAHRDALLNEFQTYRPSAERYSPIAFFFNFSHNVLKGTVIDALLRGEPWRLAFDDLLTAMPRDPEKDASKTQLANTLMGYARANPHRIRGQLMPVIVYDPDAGRRAFGVAMKKLRM